LQQPALPHVPGRAKTANGLQTCPRSSLGVWP